MRKTTFKRTAMALLTTCLLFSCKKDDTPIAPINNNLPKDETWVIFNGNEKWSGGIYALGDNKAREINLSTVPFYQLGYSAGGRIVDNILYKKDGPAATDIGISKYKLEAQIGR